MTSMDGMNSYIVHRRRPMVGITTRVDKAIVDRIDELADEHRVTRASLVRLGLNMIIKELDKKLETSNVV